MNDSATVVVSAALRCLIMLLPHIPATIAAQLPRLFLIYSRCLCWEKFSASSTKAQRDLVTDDRVRRGSDSDSADDAHDDEDPTWTSLHSLPNMPESAAPELLHYFTYLYGLYPVNFMTYVRKPRKYLKNIDFPGADEFDLDQAVIRNRTEQFQRVHLLHPNFFTTTIEEELTDNRWLKAEPSEVISECHSLYAGEQTPQTMPESPGPPPTTSLPSLPTLPPQGSASGPGATADSERDSPTLLPVADDASINTLTEETPTLQANKADDGSSTMTSPSTDVLYLQQELMLLRNELTFERYLKQQHVSAIGQLKRNHVKAVTIEAETATLINANRALQKKLGDASRFNEKMQKETQARRTHTKQSEEQLTAKIRSLKADLANQEALQRDFEQACKDCDQLRQLLVESEARELSKQEEIESFESKTESSKAALKHRDTKLELSRKSFEAKVAELEARLKYAESKATASSESSLPGVTAELQAMLADARLKLAHTKEKYAQLLDEYTDLKIKYDESVSGFSGNLDGGHAEPIFPHESQRMFQQHMVHDHQNYSPNQPVRQAYYTADQGFERMQNPSTGSSYPPARPMRPDVYQQQQQMFNATPMSRSEGASISSGSFQHPAARGAARSNYSSDYDLGPPEMVRESSKSAFSFNSDDRRSSKGEEKIKPKSDMRVYGRGEHP